MVFHEVIQYFRGRALRKGGGRRLHPNRERLHIVYETNLRRGGVHALPECGALGPEAREYYVSHQDLTRN